MYGHRKNFVINNLENEVFTVYDYFKRRKLFSYFRRK